jgi:hypothetical protein
VARRRPYDPARARWLAVDPMSAAGSANPFVYALNRSLTHIDPGGAVAFDFDSAIEQTNSCGAFFWRADWSVRGCQGKGLIVQFMTVDIECFECGPVETCGCRSCDWSATLKREPRTYTEMWYVLEDKNKGICRIYGEYCDARKGLNPSDIWCFNGCAPTTYNRRTCGRLSWKGEAFYVPLEKVDLTQYSFGAVDFAGCLLSASKHDESLRRYAVGTIRRFLSNYWTCCQDAEKSECCLTSMGAVDSNKESYIRGDSTDCVTKGEAYKCPSSAGCSCSGKSLAVD